MRHPCVPRSTPTVSCWRAILVTHHHPDHVGGVAELRPRLRGPVFGPAREAHPAALHAAARRRAHRACSACTSTVLDVPGHTAGHIAYLPGRRRRQRRRCCSAATRCSRPAADGCSKARRRRCTLRWPASPRCRPTPRCAARTSTPCPTCALPRPWSRTMRERAAMRRVARRCAPPSCPRCRLRSAVELQINPFLRCDAPEVVRSARVEGARVAIRWRCSRRFASGRTDSDDPCPPAGTRVAVLATCCLGVRRGRCWPGCRLCRTACYRIVSAEVSVAIAAPSESDFGALEVRAPLQALETRIVLAPLQPRSRLDPEQDAERTDLGSVFATAMPCRRWKANWYRSGSSGTPAAPTTCSA